MYKTAEQIANDVLLKVGFTEQDFDPLEQELQQKWDALKQEVSDHPEYAAGGGAALGGLAGAGVGKAVWDRQLKAKPKVEHLYQKYLTDPKTYDNAAKPGRIRGTLTGAVWPRRQRFTKEERLIGRVGRRLRRGLGKRVIGGGLLGAGLGTAASLAPYFIDTENDGESNSKRK